MIGQVLERRASMRSLIAVAALVASGSASANYKWWEFAGECDAFLIWGDRAAEAKAIRAEAQSKAEPTERKQDQRHTDRCEPVPRDLKREEIHGSLVILVSLPALSSHLAVPYGLLFSRHHSLMKQVELLIAD
jgi:hypothetical protein